jgi:hypothetical protein
MQYILVTLNLNQLDFRKITLKRKLECQSSSNLSLNIIGIFFLLIISMTKAYALDKTKITVIPDEKNASSFFLTLENAIKPTIEYKKKNKIILRFNNQIIIDTKSLKSLPSNINFDYGYDSILISTLKSNNLILKESNANPLTYNISINITNTKIKTNQSAELLITKLRLAQNDNDFSQGTKVSKLLEDNYIDNPFVILALAQYTFDLGQYRKSLTLQNKLDKEFPNFHHDDQLRSNLYRRREFFIQESLIAPINASAINFPYLIYKDADKTSDNYMLQAQAAYISPNDQATQINTSVDLTRSITSNSNIGVLLQNILYYDSGVQDPYTGSTGDDSASRFNTELYFQHFFKNEDFLQLSLYSGYQDIVGGGAEYLFWIPKGHIGLNLDVYKPTGLNQFDLSFGIIPVTIIYGGTTDQFYIDGDYNITNNLLWLFDLGAAQYSIKDFSNAQRTVNAFTSFSYNLNNGFDALNILDPYGTYFVTYSLYSQYLTSSQSATSISTGNEYNPIPLFTFEIHTMELAWRDLFYHQRLQPLLYGGVSYNRYGGNIGFVFGGELTYIFDDSHTASIFASRGISTQFQNSFSDTIGARFFWYF